MNSATTVALCERLPGNDACEFPARGALATASEEVRRQHRETGRVDHPLENIRVERVDELGLPRGSLPAGSRQQSC